jgi:hypothetical protein
LFTNQDKTLLTGDFTSLQTSAPFDLVETQSTDPVRMNWWYEIRDGDSGNPVFHVINGALVLVMLWHYMSSPATASGPIYADNISQINTAIAATGSTSTVTIASLSGFNTY